MNLPKSPLVYVVAQVNFSAVESMATYIPDIQDRLRRKGFPRFVQGEFRAIRVTLNAPPQVTPVPRYEFQDKGRRTGVVVSKEFVTLHVSEYRTFERFCDVLSTSLEIIHSVVGIGLVERVGLRYVNLVRAKGSEGFAQFLDPGLLGLDESKYGATHSKIMSQVLGQTEIGTLAIRLFQRDDGSFLPPDAEPSPLDHPDPELGQGEVVSLLDLDHFKLFEKAAMEFSVESVMRLFWQLHDNTDLAFRAAVTPHALETWGRND